MNEQPQANFFRIVNNRNAPNEEEILPPQQNRLEFEIDARSDLAKKIKIGFHNVNGLLDKAEMIAEHINKEGYDLFFLSETRLHPK